MPNAKKRYDASSPKHPFNKVNSMPWIGRKNICRTARHFVLIIIDKKSRKRINQIHISVNSENNDDFFNAQFPIPNYIVNKRAVIFVHLEGLIEIFLR